MSCISYAGGKTRAIKYINRILEKEFDLDKCNILISPFFGGGSFELAHQRATDCKVYANDIDPYLINFWK